MPLILLIQTPTNIITIYQAITFYCWIRSSRLPESNYNESISHITREKLFDMTQIFTALRVLLLIAGCSKCQDVSSSAPKVSSEPPPSSKVSGLSTTSELDPTFSLTSLVPSSTSSADPSPNPATEEVLAGDRVMGKEEEADHNMDIEEEISKLLSTEAVEDKKLKSRRDYENDNLDLDPSPVQEKTLNTEVEDSFNQEGLDTLESAKVKEAALDDKLSIELRGIVQQIQVSGFTKIIVEGVYSNFSRTCKKKLLLYYKKEGRKCETNITHL